MDFFSAQNTILWNKNASEGGLWENSICKFKIINKFKQNIDETHSKQPKIYENPHQPMDFKNLKKKNRELKVSTLLPNVCDFQKEIHTLGYGFKNL